MKEKPILFSNSMVCALLHGCKTQTRRIVKPQPANDKVWAFQAMEIAQKMTWGQPGDLLWVREGFRAGGDARYENFSYKADYHHEMSGFSSPIHMPREASRLTLELTQIRVQQLEDISKEDAIAEGIHHYYYYHELMRYVEETRALGADEVDGEIEFGAFAQLWESIHGEESWELNPWVWALSFKVHKQNIDEFLKERKV